MCVHGRDPRRELNKDIFVVMWMSIYLPTCRIYTTRTRFVYIIKFASMSYTQYFVNNLHL